MSTGMRKWMEKGCPETQCLPAQVSIDREELKQLRDHLEAAEKDVALKEQVIDALGSELNAVAKERDALRNEIAYVKEVEFPRKAQAVADAWKGKCKRLEVERDALRAKIAEMEQQEPARLVTATAYRWRYRGAVKWQYGELTEETARRAKEHNHEVQPLYALPGAQPAPSVPECPYPCGWRNLLKHAIEDGAYLARSINEDEPVTENARAVTMRTVMRLRNVLMAINNAAPEAKP